MRYVCSNCHGNQYNIWVDGEDGTVEKDDCVCKQMGLPPFIEVQPTNKSTAKIMTVELQKEEPCPTSEPSASGSSLSK